MLFRFFILFTILLAPFAMTAFTKEPGSIVEKQQEEAILGGTGRLTAPEKALVHKKQPTPCRLSLLVQSKYPVNRSQNQNAIAFAQKTLEQRSIEHREMMKKKGVRLFAISLTPEKTTDQRPLIVFYDIHTGKLLNNQVFELKALPSEDENALFQNSLVEFIKKTD